MLLANCQALVCLTMDGLQILFKTIIDICLKQFGENRCMFGSNFPVDKLYSSYETLFESYKEIIPKECHETVFYKVAKDFYFY